MSYVIYLRKDRKVVEPPYSENLPNGKPLHIFFYEAIKLWELPTEVFLQQGMEGLLPLVTLTHDGKRREVVDEMITRLVASHNNNLLSMAYNFAALVYDKPVEHEWLIERFEMYKKDLEESWVYQRILKEGLEKGQREVLPETLISFLHARYPMLVDLAREQIGGITDIKRLQEILNKVFYLQTAGEIEEYLLSLHDDATKN